MPFRYWRVCGGVADIAAVAVVASVADVAVWGAEGVLVRVWAVDFFVVWMYLICCGKGVNLLSV